MDKALDKALREMILSASGWRGIFAENGDEESTAPGISEVHRIIAAAAAKVFSDYLSKTVPLSSGGNRKGVVIAGRDTRPTGEAIADAVIRSLLSEGWDLCYTGVAAAPEIMAFARSRGGNGAERVAGFIYISASHNPAGHNGIKFGLTDGGVLQASETGLLKSAFESFMASPGRVERARALLEKANAEQLAAVYAAASGNKKAALEAYRNFTEEVISGSPDKNKQERFFAVMREGLKKRPLGIAVDFNGSARTVCVDRDFLTSLGAGFYAVNEIPGQIAHRIVPEGESLEPCRVFMEGLRNEVPAPSLGYVPDCDGDRGNLVIRDEGKNAARALEAQEVFALACVAELASLVWTGELKIDANGKALTKAAIAVNDPTSLRIDRIAKAFGVSVFRAEVGEANVVGLARKLRGEGYLVRFLGEGSAGGVIIHPSAVRDPLATVGSALKLLSVRDGPGKGLAGMGLFGIWCALSDKRENYRDDFTLTDILDSLPAFTTTGAYSEDALLKIKTQDHGLLKERYQKFFLKEWEEKKEFLFTNYGLSKWEAIAYNGMIEKRGISRFGESGRGGLKIEFSGENKSACIWMRGSGTEPVFRVMADAEGSGPHLERTLIEWQRRMVREADLG